MNDKFKRVLRTALAGAVTGALTALGATQTSDVASIDAAKALGWIVVNAAIAGAWSAIHNYVIDPSPIPSLAPSDTDTGAPVG